MAFEEQFLINALARPEEALWHIDKAECEESLIEYTSQAWSVLEPGRRFIPGWPAYAISEHLEAVSLGEINRLLINVPPGFMKSMLTSVFWPSFEWGPLNRPWLRYLCTSHSQTFTTRDSLRMRRLITSPWYQERWGDRVKLTSDQAQKTKYENTATGFREAVPASSMTGARGDRVIIDDPLSRDDASSEATLDSMQEWFLETVPTRVNDSNSAIVVIMQRLHDRDTSGIILANNLGYEHLCIPMRYEPKRKFYTSIGWEDPRTIEGELAWPERFSEETVKALEKSLKAYGCTPYESPVLMADLTMKPIGEVKTGDIVVGFDKKERKDNVKGRFKLTRSEVINTYRYKNAEIVKMTLDSGKIIRCTSDHKWFVGEKGYDEKGNKRPIYLPATEGKTKLMRICEPELPKLTNAEDIRLAGWLSGFYDGEGTVSLSQKTEQDGDFRASTTIHFYQGSGRNAPLCEKLEYALNKFEFDFYFTEDERKDNKTAACYGYRDYVLRSGNSNALSLAQKFMHIVQPTKWKERLIEGAYGAKFIIGKEKVIKIEHDGYEDVYALETTTGNYVVWGLASSNSAGQLQQSPEIRGGSIIKRDWWKVHVGDLPRFDYIVAALDTAYTSKKENDPSAMVVVGAYSENFHTRFIVLYSWEDHLEFHDLMNKVNETCVKFGVETLIIEAKASGLSIEQEMKRVFSYDNYSIITYNPTGDGDKVGRAWSVVPILEEGLVSVRGEGEGEDAEPYGYAKKLIDRCAKFPKGEHDDVVDALVMSLKHLRRTGVAVLKKEHTIHEEELRRPTKRLSPLYPV